MKNYLDLLKMNILFVSHQIMVQHLILMNQFFIENLDKIRINSIIEKQVLLAFFSILCYNI